MSKIIFTEEGTKPPAPSVGQVSMYVKTDEVVYIQDSSGLEIPLGSASSITSLTGEATGSGPGAAVVTLSNSAVIGKVLTGFSPGPNSSVLSTDTILQALQKLQAQVSGTTAITSLTGDVSATGPGSVTATVNSVGGQSAANISQSVLDTQAATPSNIASTIVKRDASGNFSANIITATLNGNASTSTTSTNFSGSLSGDVTGTQSSTVVATVGGKTASDIASAVTLVDAATSSNTANTLVERDASGNFAANVITANLIGNVSGSSSTFTGSLSGDVTGTQSATSISSPTVTGKVLTGYVVGSNTPIASTDSILIAFEKTQGQLNATSGAAITALTGDVSATGPGSATATVNSIGGSSAANVHSAELAANAATSSNTPSTIVKRDGSGNFSAGTITASLIGNATTSTTSTNFSGSLSGDVTGTQSATAISDTTVTGKLITGFVSAPGTVTAADSILTAIDKLNGNITATSGSAITALTGDVVATGPGSAAATIQPNTVTNSKLAQMPANTLKGNNTGSTANSIDLTSTQVTAILNSFTQDTAVVSGLQGLVPAPAAGTTKANDFLAPSGWKYVDQSKPRLNDFSLITQTPGPAGTQKFQSVTLAGNYAYLAGGQASPTLSIYDISNQTSPVLKGSLNLLGSYQIAVQGNYAYVPSSGGFVLYVVNISDPTNPTITGSVSLGAATGSLYTCVVSGNYVYISTQSKGLTVVDVSNPASPVQVYQEGGTLNKSFGIAKSGNTVYTTNYQTTSPWTVRYFKTWDVSTPTAPVLQNTYTLPANTKPNQIGLSGNLAFITDTNQNLVHILDITTPTAPVFKSSLTPSGIFNADFVAAVVSSGDKYVYVPSGSDVTYGGFIDMFDLTSVTSPLKVATVKTNVPTSVFGGISISNGYIYAADYGIAPGNSGTLDVFTLPEENAVAGNTLTSTLTVKTGAATNYVLTSDSVGNATWQVNSPTTFSGSLSGDVTGTQSATTVATVGGSSAANIHSAELAANAATNLNTASTIVKRDASGNFNANIITANLNGNANTATSAISFTGTLVGDVTGNQGSTVVATVGGSSAANVHSAELAANAATNLNTVSTIVKRDSSGNFSAGTITASLAGNATTSTSFTSSLVGDVTGTQSATVVSIVGGSSAANIHTAELAANAATSINTPSTIVKRDASGEFHISSVDLDGATSGTAIVKAASTTTSYTILLPSSQGSNGSYLANDGSGNLSWTNPVVNLDGGAASSNYTSSQIINGGTA